MDDKVKIQKVSYDIFVILVEEDIYFFLDVENISVIFIIQKHTRFKVCKEVWCSKYFTYVARIRGLWDRT